jgi:hypothetical protein
MDYYAVLEGLADDGTILALRTGSKNLTPEQTMWKASLVQAILYATYGCSIQCNVNQGFPIREAQAWFKLRSYELGGWGFVAEALCFSDWQIRRVENYVAEREPIDLGIRMRG